MTEHIVTLTLNPAVDIACVAPRVLPEHKLRTSGETYDPGGGGVNVARVIHDLGGQARAIILVGGATGLLYEELLGAHGVPYTAIPIRGRTRVALNVRESETGQEYRFVPEGPEVAADEWQAVLAELETTEAGWVVASGSLPRGVPDDFYAQAATIARRRGQYFVLDSSGPPLKAALAQGITLAKPSLREFESLVGHDLPDAAAREAAAQSLLRDGAVEMLVVSLGRDGAMLATSHGITHLVAPDVAVQSAVGAGDSFVGGITLALARGDNPQIAFAHGVATGAAAVASAGTAHPDPALAEALFRRLTSPA